MTKGARSEIVKCEKTHQTILRDLPSQSGYLKENTWTELLPESTSPELLVGSSVRVYAPAIDGYICVSANPQTITLKTEAAENIITFYCREATSAIPPVSPRKSRSTKTPTRISSTATTTSPTSRATPTARFAPSRPSSAPKWSPWSTARWAAIRSLKLTCSRA